MLKYVWELRFDEGRMLGADAPFANAEAICRWNLDPWALNAFLPAKEAIS